MQSPLRFIPTFIWLVVQIANCAAVPNVALVEFPLTGNDSPINLPGLGALMDKGEELLRAKYGNILNAASVRLSDRNVTTCAMLEQKAIFWLSRYYYQQAEGNPMMAFFGPVCSAPAVHVAGFAREWNAPMFAMTFENTNSAQMSSKKRYPTLTRVSPYIHEDLTQFVFKILKYFSYDTVGILCDDANDTTNTYVPLCTGLFDWLRLAYNVSASRFYVNATDPVNVKHYLDEIKSIARVVFIIGHGSRIRPIMLAAYDNNMTNGDYAYFTFELYPSRRLFGDISWNSENTDGRNQDAREAYRSILVLSLRPDDTPAYRDFTNEIKRLSMQNYGYSYADGEEVDPVAMAHYYALAVYGQVFNETVAKGGDPGDGRAISRNMRNRTFTVLGNDIVINANGDRDADWRVSQMDPETGLFQPVQEYFARERMLRLYRHPAIWHKGNQMPPNEPPCGYRGTKNRPQCHRGIVSEGAINYPELFADIYGWALKFWRAFANH